MNKERARKIMDMSQGACGIIDVIEQNNIFEDLGESSLPNVTVGHLYTALKVFCHELNGLTEDLDCYNFISKGGEISQDSR